MHVMYNTRTDRTTTPGLRTHALRARLLTLAVSTALATTGLTALGAITLPASASVMQTEVFVGDLNGGFGVYNATNGTKTFTDDHLSGIPVDLIANPAGTLLYEVDTMDDYVSVFSTQTDAGVGSLPVCNRPQSEALNAATSTLYVSCNTSNGGSDTEVDVINAADPAALTLTARIPFPSSPYGMVVDTATNMLYVDDDYGIAKVSMATNTVTGSFGAPAGSLALNAAGSVLYDAVGNQVYLIAVSSNSVFGSLTLPAGTGSSAICPSTGMLYVAGNGVTTVINTTIPAVVGSLALSGGSLALSSDCGTLFELNGDSVDMANTATGAISAVSFPANDILSMAVARVPVQLIYNPTPLPLPFSALP